MTHATHLQICMRKKIDINISVRLAEKEGEEKREHARAKEREQEITREKEKERELARTQERMRK